MRNSSPANIVGRLGIGESLVNTTSGPTAFTAVHGQFVLHEALNDATTIPDVSVDPS
jgi:hypothetical protein